MADTDKIRADNSLLNLTLQPINLGMLMSYDKTPVTFRGSYFFESLLITSK